MAEELNRLDINLFLWLNGHYSSWADPIMVWVTERNTWLPFYLLLVSWLIYHYRKRALGIGITLILAVALADQLTSSFLKPLTHRLRPCHDPVVQGLIHPVMECGGRYGFASSHAATSFALAMALWLTVGDRFPAVKWVFLWAALLSYSRIYVGAHYPLDILAGTGIGLAMAWISYWFYHRLQEWQQARMRH